MREIKFRGWYTGESREKGMYYDLQDQYDEFPLPLPCFGDLLENDDLVIMQYTGLKDSHDKEIYEGDIIKQNWGKNEYVEEIKDMGFDLKFSLLESGGEIEVLGNIYENPKLLTQQSSESTTGEKEE